MKVSGKLIRIRIRRLGDAVENPSPLPASPLSVVIMAPGLESGHKEITTVAVRSYKTSSISSYSKEETDTCEIKQVLLNNLNTRHETLPNK